MMHFLPKDKYPVNRLPIDLYIANRIAYQRKMEREGKPLVEETADKKGKGLTYA